MNPEAIDEIRAAGALMGLEVNFIRYAQGHLVEIWVPSLRRRAGSNFFRYGKRGPTDRHYPIRIRNWLIWTAQTWQANN